MDASQRSAFWQLQGCVVLWGFTSILGRLITLPALALVVWRMALAALLLSCLPKSGAACIGWMRPRYVGTHSQVA